MNPSATETLRVRVPASTSNLGAGFDTVGLAVQMYLEVEAIATGSELKIEVKGRDADKIPLDSSNLIYRSLAEHAAGSLPKGLTLRILNDIPLTRGFGSSSAAIVAGISLGEWIRCGTPPERQIVVDAATHMEGHPDNVTAAVLGGLTVSAVIDEEIIANSLRIPSGLEIVAIIPDRELSTQKAREVLPLSIPRADAIFNLQRLGLLLTGLFLNRKNLLVHGVADAIHQNRRAKLFPPMGDVVNELNRNRDCLGAFVSGAGPSIAAFTDGHGPVIGERGVAVLEKQGISAEYRILAPEYLGLTFL